MLTLIVTFKYFRETKNVLIKIVKLFQSTSFELRAAEYRDDNFGEMYNHNNLRALCIVYPQAAAAVLLPLVTLVLGQGSVSIVGTGLGLGVVPPAAQPRAGGPPCRCTFFLSSNT